MKEYCVDLEIAKELKENGFPQLFSDSRDCYYNDPKLETGYGNIYYFAPSSDEILKELPKTINKDYHIGMIIDIDNNYQVFYEKETNDPYHDFEFRIIDQKFSNGLALTWLYLKREGYIK